MTLHSRTASHKWKQNTCAWYISLIPENFDYLLKPEKYLLN